MYLQRIKSLIIVILILIHCWSCESFVEPPSLFKEKSNLEPELENGCSRLPGKTNFAEEQARSMQASPFELAKLTSERKSNCRESTYGETSDFKCLRSYMAYVDKSDMIRVALNHAAVFVQAPTRFGKSSIISMFWHFFSGRIDLSGNVVDAPLLDSYKLFSEKPPYLEKKLSIFTEDPSFFKAHFGQYPVVSLDFSRIELNNESTFLRTAAYHLIDATSINLVDLENSNKVPDFWMQELKFARSALRSKEVTLGDILFYINRLIGALNHAFGRDTIVLIDEFDSPITRLLVENSSIFESSETPTSFNLFAKLVRCLVKRAAREPEITLAFLTGITPYGAVYSHEANNIKYRLIFSYPEYAKYYGLSEREVEKLMQRYEIKNETFYSRIKEMYDGYAIVGSPEKLFSTISVTECIGTGICEDNWIANTPIKRLLPPFYLNYLGEQIFNLVQASEPIRIDFDPAKVEKISFTELRVIRKLINDNAGTIFLTKDQRNLLLQYFFVNGYLTIIPGTKTLTYPNQEVKIALQYTLKKALGKDTPTEMLVEGVRDAFSRLIPGVTSTKVDQLCEWVSRLKNLTRNRPLNEAGLAERITLALGMAYIPEVHLYVEQDTSLRGTKVRGRPDRILVIPNKLLGKEENDETYTCYLLEMKYIKETAGEAIEQIDTQKYLALFERFTKTKANFPWKKITNFLLAGIHANVDWSTVTASVTFIDSANINDFLSDNKTCKPRSTTGNWSSKGKGGN